MIFAGQVRVHEQQLRALVVLPHPQSCKVVHQDDVLDSITGSVRDASSKGRLYQKQSR